MVTDIRPTTHLAKRARRQRLRQATGRILPTLATLGNLICGFAAIYYAAKGARMEAAPATPHVTAFTLAGWLIFLAMVFDALDGRLARMVRSTSDLGAQLDSLADVVSFGVAPGFLMYQLLAVRIGGPWFQDQWIAVDGVEIVGRTIWVIAALFACCAALRLARFNVETTADESSHMWFKGLPSPGAAAAIASLVLLLENLVRNQSPPWAVKAVFCALPPVALATALLMVSNVPYAHATNHFIRGRHPFRNLVLALMLLGVLLIARQHALTVIAVGYALFGPIFLAYRHLTRRDTRTVDELAAEVVDDEDEDAEPDSEQGGPSED